MNKEELAAESVLLQRIFSCSLRQNFSKKLVESQSPYLYIYIEVILDNRLLLTAWLFLDRCEALATDFLLTLLFYPLQRNFIIRRNINDIETI